MNRKIILLNAEKLYRKHKINIKNHTKLNLRSSFCFDTKAEGNARKLELKPKGPREKSVTKSIEPATEIILIKTLERK